MISILGNLGVRGRLLLAFLGISAFAVLAAVAAILAFSKVEQVLNRITNERMPASIAALELSRDVERLASFAPLMLSGSNPTDRMRTDRIVRTELMNVAKLFGEIESGDSTRESLGELRSTVSDIRQNIALLQTLLDPYAFEDQSTYLQESGRRARAEALLRRNAEISAQLKAAVDRFVEGQRAEVDKAVADVAETRKGSTAFLLAVVALSLIGSSLIVWLYVGRNMIRRLSALSHAMLAIARGDLKAPLPVDAGNDEIGKMADALRTFRDTADEVERVGRLKRFLAPQVAELIVSSGSEGALESHRREVAVLFCDLRGFTAFAEIAEPEELMEMLRQYHSCLGELVKKFAGTLERFTGDGLIVLFNDPLPCPDPCLAAARLAVEMRAGVNQLVTRWRQGDARLGFGIGIAYGYATLGRIGFDYRFDYTAIGPVVNLAARLCERAKAGEILIDTKVRSEIDRQIETETLGEVVLKGFSRPVDVFNIASTPE